MLICLTDCDESLSGSNRVKICRVGVDSSGVKICRVVDGSGVKSCRVDVQVITMH